MLAVLLDFTGKNEFVFIAPYALGGLGESEITAEKVQMSHLNIPLRSLATLILID